MATVIDAALLAGLCDGVLLVLDPKTSDRKVLKMAQNQLEKVGVRILGLVLNKISQDRDGYYYYSYYHYSDYYTDKEGESQAKTHHKRRRSKSVAV